MYSGLIIKESMKNSDIFKDNDLKISKTESWKLRERAADFQPKTWTAIFIEGNEEKIDTIAKKISNSILPRWYANVSNNTTEYVIFNEKIFKHKKGNKEEAKEAISYGKSVGIPEHQLDWT